MQSIERAFAVLRALAVGGHGVTELADKVELPKSTVARILAALETEGAVAQDESGGEYRLGDGLTDLAGGVQPGRNLAATARPHLIELAKIHGETAGISVADGRNVYYLDHVHLDNDVQVRDWTGEYAPMHLVPSGLVFLANMSDVEVDSFLTEPLIATTATSVTKPQELRDRLPQFRSAGYVWILEEFIEGINSVATAIVDSSGETVAALHIHGPAYRFPDPDRTHDIGLSLIEAASNLAAQLDD
ncbi:MAG: IclR family transcriptional regulator [Acidimicrobiales bacterium]